MKETTSPAVAHDADAQTRLVRSLVRLNGGNPDQFRAAFTSDGGICVLGPTAAAFYPVDAWLTRFTRHLEHGFFQAAQDGGRAGPRPR